MVKPRRQPTPQTVPVHQGVSLGVASSADETFPTSLDVNGLSDKISPPVSVNLILEKDEIPHPLGSIPRSINAGFNMERRDRH